MSVGLRKGGRPYKTLEYLVYHPAGLNAYLANRMWDELALHSTISALRNVHGASYIRSFPIPGRLGRPHQYLIEQADIPRAKELLRSSVSVSRVKWPKGGAGRGAIEG